MTDPENFYDCVIIGGGPAAYTAALFMTHYNKENKDKCFKLLLVSGGYDLEIGPGGQLTTTTDVDNYPGFPKGIQGPEMMEIMQQQIKDSKIEVLTETVIALEKAENNMFAIKMNEKSVLARAVIIGTGSTAKKLHNGNVDEFWNKGVSACAVCDGFFYKDKTAVVIGGGDTAMEEATYLSNICSKVIIIHRRNEFRARADNLQKLRGKENVEILTPYELVECNKTIQEDFLKEVVVKNKETGELKNISTEGLFFAIGHTPNTSFIKIDALEILENKYVKTEDEVVTTVPGVFACGDVQDFVFRQGVTAAGSGCKAAQKAFEFLKQ